MNPEFEKLCNNNAITFTITKSRIVFCEYFFQGDSGWGANEPRRIRLDLSLDDSNICVYTRYISIPHSMPANWEGAI